MALNYSGRMEILEAVKRIAREYKANRIKLNDLDEGKFANYLFTHPLPDPDLLIQNFRRISLIEFSPLADVIYGALRHEHILA